MPVWRALGHGHLADLGLIHPESLPADAAREVYLSAARELAAGNFAGALGKFISVIRANRYYDDDGSRKACIAVFRFLGDEHEVTRSFRREFGSALNV